VQKILTSHLHAPLPNGFDARVAATTVHFPYILICARDRKSTHEVWAGVANSVPLFSGSLHRTPHHARPYRAVRCGLAGDGAQR